jgi:KDO2-lipid IV(A) lauroyltransferase
MDIEALINHEYGIRTGLAVARLLPRSISYRLARFLAGRIARRDQPWVRAVRSNQWVVSGEQASASELDTAVQKVFEYRACSIVDLYHSIHVRERILEAVEFDASAMQMIERSQKGEEGLVLVVPHTGNYELAGLAAAIRGGVGAALTNPEQPGGYKYHDKIRRDYGIQAMPASISTFKVAAQALREGRFVATGIDRPLPDAGHRPRFFGRPTAVPVHYVVLAMKANVPMMLAHTHRRSDGRQVVSASDPIPVENYGDRRTTIAANAERMLQMCEEIIKRDPYQWAMFFSVWPEANPNGRDS